MESKTFEGAVLGVIPQLNLFEPPMVQSGVERAFFVEYRPTAQFNGNAPVHFSLGGESAHYLDLKRSRLYVKLQLLKDDGKPLAQTDVACPINLILQSMWSQVEVKISGKTVSVSNNAYPFKAYLQTLLKSSDSHKISTLTAQGYYHDTGDSNKIIGNTGALARTSFFSKSQSVELEGPILEDIFQTNRLILNNTQVDIKLFRANDQFTCMTKDDTLKVKLNLEDIHFKACYVSVHPGVLAGHAAALRNSNAIYPYTRVEMMTFNLSSGTRQFNLDNLFNSDCPTRVLVSFVDAEAFHGTYQTSPFKFSLNSISEIELTADGYSVPGRALTVGETSSDSKGRQVVVPYNALMDVIGSMNSTHFGNGLDLTDFATGYAIFAYSIYGSNQMDSNFIQMKKNANIRVHGHFASALDKPVAAIVYAEFPATLEIENSRNIILT